MENNRNCNQKKAPELKKNSNSSTNNGANNSNQNALSSNQESEILTHNSDKCTKPSKQAIEKSTASISRVASECNEDEKISDASVTSESKFTQPNENGQAANEQKSNGQKKKEVEAQACQTSSLNSNSNCELSQAVNGLHITTNSPKSQAENGKNVENSENSQNISIVQLVIYQTSLEGLKMKIYKKNPNVATNGICNRCKTCENFQECKG